jgi:hypothetical protein
MRQRATAIAVALGLAAAFACSSTESNVVNQYFTALRANDTTTLTSFAVVAFDKKVDDWKVVSVGPETRTPVTLPDLVKKQTELEAELAANSREARAWANDLSVYPKLDQVRELEKADKKVPASLEPIRAKWAAFNEKDRDLKNQVADAKAAVSKEKRNTQLSVGTQFEDTIEQMTGEVISKDVDVNLTIDGKVQPYVMVLRRYDLKTEGAGPRMVSRWVVQSLTPKQ